MKHPISPDTSGLYEKIWNFVREQLSVRYPFFRRLLWNFFLSGILRNILCRHRWQGHLFLSGFSHKNVSG